MFNEKKSSRKFYLGGVPFFVYLSSCRFRISLNKKGSLVLAAVTIFVFVLFAIPGSYSM